MWGRPMLVVDTVFISAVSEPFRRRATRRSQIGQLWTVGEVTGIVDDFDFTYPLDTGSPISRIS